MVSYQFFSDARVLIECGGDVVHLSLDDKFPTLSFCLPEGLDLCIKVSDGAQLSPISYNGQTQLLTLSSIC